MGIQISVFHLKIPLGVNFAKLGELQLCYQKSKKSDVFVVSIVGLNSGSLENSGFNGSAIISK